MNRQRIFIILAAVAVALVTLVAFLPTRHAGFLNWDDDALILQNADFRGLGWRQLRWMFTTTYMGHYQPLTWVSFAANYLADGLAPAGYHVTNVLFHSAAAVGVFLVARRVLRAGMPTASGTAVIVASAFAAFLFSLHPLRVESVAWVTERRDVLSGSLLLGSIWAYLGYAQASVRHGRWYGLSIALLFLSLLAKAWGMTACIVLVVLDVYPLRRWSRASAARLLVEKTPFLVLGLAAAGAAFFAQRGAVAVVDDHGWSYRMLQSVYGLSFYLWKTVLPINLSPIYEHPLLVQPRDPRFAGAVAFVVVLTVGLFILRRRWPAGLTAWSIYVIVVSPVLGLVQAGPQFVADRYSYLACIPFAILAAAGMLALARRGGSRWVVVGGCSILIALLVLTERQIPRWRDSWSVWRTAIEYDPGSWNANTSLGSLHFSTGELEQAEHYYRRAYDAKPSFALPVTNLATCLGRQGKLEESLTLFRKAAGMKNASSSDLLMIGNGLTLLKQPGEARIVFERLIGQNPGDAEPHFRLAGLFLSGGDTSGAIEHYRKVVELLDPALAAGPIDVKHDLFAAMYAGSCRQLMGQLAAQGDTVGAESYRRKLAAISARDQASTSSNPRR